MVRKKEAPTAHKTESIGQRMRRLRKARGITQVEMAERLSTTQGIVSRYERGGQRLHGELIVKLAEILDVSADELLGLEVKQRRPLPPALKDRRLLVRMQRLDRLSNRDREMVIRMVDALLARGAPSLGETG